MNLNNNNARSKVNPILRLQELSQGTDFGAAQKVEHESHRKIAVADVVQRMESTREYMKNTQVTKDIKDMCRNTDEMCTLWALAGECSKNPKYMKKSCAPACQSCEYLAIEGRCPLDPEAPRAWESGDLDKMFQRLSSEPFKTEYQVEILSSPPEGPWVITMENVVSEEEAKRLLSSHEQSLWRLHLHLNQPNGTPRSTGLRMVCWAWSLSCNSGC